MSTVHSAATGGGAIDGESRRATAVGIADGLCLAAAPTFAMMALLTAVSGGGGADMLCAAGHASPLSGMVPMYLMMSAVHLAPWLKLVFGLRNGAPA
jgi:hypothetical protein